jgi:hypothetical protein
MVEQKVNLHKLAPGEGVLLAAICCQILLRQGMDAFQILVPLAFSHGPAG